MKKAKMLKKLHKLARCGRDWIGGDDLAALQSFIIRMINKEEARGRVATERLGNGYIKAMRLTKGE